MDKERIPYLDYLKGTAMLLVVWLHCIQFVFGSSFDNVFFAKVISFHMPLFMIISGLLFFRKLRDEKVATIIKKQFQHLIIPCISFGLLSFVISDNIYLNMWGGIFYSISLLVISSLFICSLLYLFSYRILNKRMAIHWLVIALSALTLFQTFSLYLMFFIPFFGLGLILADKSFFQGKINYTWIQIVIVIALLMLWDYKYSIYKTSFPSELFQVYVYIKKYIMRIVIGGVISLSLILLFKKYERLIPFKNFLQLISKNSLLIYVIHMTFLPMVKLDLHLSEILETMVSLVIALLLIIVMNYFISLVRKNSILSFLLEGRVTQK